MKKTKDTHLELEIPQGTSIEVEKNRVSVSGPKGKFTREFNPRVKIDKKDNRVVLKTKSARRADKALLCTIRTHIKNMFHGVSDGITYKLKIVYTHFPMSPKAQGSELVIDNFMGEKFPRRAAILNGVKVEVKGRDVLVTGISKEDVAQTAANIEQTTRIKDRDHRVFQDGIYLVEKDGVPIA